jgi:hypothetical protein
MCKALLLFFLFLAPVHIGRAEVIPFYLAEGPLVSIPPSPAPSPEQVEHIQGLIKRLVTLDHMADGLSGSGWSFTPFAPVPLERPRVAEARDAPAVRAFDELVSIGPATIPYLLAELTNATPTRLTIERGRRYMTTVAGLSGNYAVVRERPTFSELERGTDIDQHTVTVGDVCFAALGQITGRNYWPISYMPTDGTFVQSPSRNPRIGERAKAIWSGADPGATLFASLDRDLRTRGILIERNDADYIFRASQFQCDAVRRLLFYFPEQGVPLVVRRIDGLGRGWVFSTGMLERRFVRESVIHEDLLAVCAQFPHPEVRAAIARYQRRMALDKACNGPYAKGLVLAMAIMAGWRFWKRRQAAIPAPPSSNEPS